MSKNVFRPNEIIMVDGRVNIKSPESAEPAREEIIPAEEYTGPTAEDLRREAEEFKVNWVEEKQRMIDEARGEADKIIKDAEKQAFEDVRKKNEQAQKEKKESEQEAERILEEARSQVEAMIQEAENKRSEIREEAKQNGLDEGREQGFQEGREEVQRLVDRVHTVLDKAIDKRGEIIKETETQLVDLVLLISKKVIKVISENQKNVVINNVIQALRKLKSRGDVAIRVNLADLTLATEHVKDFTRMVENVKSVSVLEDSTVDRGGCLIETDFGQIDARISSQLREIEEKILELMPFRAKGDNEM